jgi:hypothetical protein
MAYMKNKNRVFAPRPEPKGLYRDPEHRLQSIVKNVLKK